MTQFSHSRAECFNQCPYKYKLRYLDNIEMLPNDDPANALIIGTALHTGIEKDVKTAIQEYYMSYPVITDAHVTEAMKLEKVIPMMKAKLPPGGIFEEKIEDEDFVGFIDYLVCVDMDFDENGDEVYIYDMYDFKYSNNIDRYLESGQLHEYKYYFEKNNPGCYIRDMYFMFAPKCQLKQKYKNKTNKFDEDIQAFRRRCLEWIDNNEVIVEKVEYNPSKINEFKCSVKLALEQTEFKKECTKLCYFCEYRSLCEQGLRYEVIEERNDENMKLPSSERRDITKDNYKKIWIYGPPFSGKTTFVDKAPSPINLNTDGNIKYVTMPYVAIRDEVKVEGRQTITTLAWGLFKDTIAELQKKDNDFETIVVDLLEDTYEYCRLYMYDQLGITHESDDSFRAWDKVRTEFLSTIKKLLNLDYNIVLISHEDTSKDIMKKGGDKVTAIKPNINDKVANKIAGMVDVVGRVVADGDIRTLSFKTDEVIFGGGRLNLDKKDIPLDWGDLMKVYGDSTPVEKPTRRTTKTSNTTEVSNSEIKEEKSTRRSKKSVEMTEEQKVMNIMDGGETEAYLSGERTFVTQDIPVVEEKPTRTRKARKTEEPVEEVKPAEEQPVRRTRRVRGA